jgi:hypothetical protein
MKKFLPVAVFTTATLCPAATITLGNNPQPNECNVMLNTGATGTTVTGTLQAGSGCQPSPTVMFASTTGQTLIEPAMGQARIETPTGVALNSLTISLAGGQTYQDLIFNLAVIGNATQGGTANISVLSPTSASLGTSSFALGNGNNFVTIVAASGEQIASTAISVSGGAGFASFQQPRISGPFTTSGGGGGQVPEPTTYALLGVGLLFLAGVRRLRAGQLC